MRNYRVEMNTELGRKKGTLQLSVCDSKVSGFLTILKHKEPFCGNIFADGSCRLQGKVVTLLQEMAYIATGNIDRESLLLHMRLGQSDYVLKGFATEE